MAIEGISIMSTDAEQKIEIPWTFTSNEEIDEAIEWLNADSVYLFAAAKKYHENGNSWLAEQVKNNGQHSLAMSKAIANCRASLLGN